MLSFSRPTFLCSELPCIEITCPSYDQRSGTMRFSSEKGNLRSLSSYKYSGLANSKTIDVSATASNTALLTTRTASKADKSPKVGFAKIPINKPFASVVKTICSQTADKYYRPDLKDSALAKYSIIYKANRIAKGVKKATPVKTGRK